MLHWSLVNLWLFYGSLTLHAFIGCYRIRWRKLHRDSEEGSEGYMSSQCCMCWCQRIATWGWPSAPHHFGSSSAGWDVSCYLFNSCHVQITLVWNTTFVLWLDKEHLHDGWEICSKQYFHCVGPEKISLFRCEISCGDKLLHFNYCRLYRRWVVEIVWRFLQVFPLLQGWLSN